MISAPGGLVVVRIYFRSLLIAGLCFQGAIEVCEHRPEVELRAGKSGLQFESAAMSLLRFAKTPGFGEDHTQVVPGCREARVRSDGLS